MNSCNMHGSLNFYVFLHPHPMFLLDWVLIQWISRLEGRVLISIFLLKFLNESTLALSASCIWTVLILMVPLRMSYILLLGAAFLRVLYFGCLCTFMTLKPDCVFYDERYYTYTRRTYVWGNKWIDEQTI